MNFSLSKFNLTIYINKNARLFIKLLVSYTTLGKSSMLYIKNTSMKRPMRIRIIRNSTLDLCDGMISKP